MSSQKPTPYTGPSAAHMLATRTFASCVITNHGTNNEILDDRELALLKEFVENPGSEYFFGFPFHEDIVNLCPFNIAQEYLVSFLISSISYPSSPHPSPFFRPFSISACKAYFPLADQSFLSLLQIKTRFFSNTTCLISWTTRGMRKAV